MNDSKNAEAVELSLDDYISKKGIVSSLRPKPNTSSTYKRILRSDMDDDESDNEMIFEDRQGNSMDAESSSLREVKLNGAGELEEIDNEEKKPAIVSIHLDSERECRTFTTEEMKRGIKKLPSQQWRLRRENQVSKKPSGLPPLMSVKAVFDRNTDQLIASLGENAKFQNADAKDRANQQLQNNKRQWYNNRKPNRKWNNGFQNRNNQNNNNRSNAGFIANVSSAQMDKNQIRDLRPFISPPPLVQSQSMAGTGLWRPMAPMNQPRQLTSFVDVLNQIGQSTDSQNPFANVIRNVIQSKQQQQNPLGALMPMLTADNVTRNSYELMPFAAQTMFNHIAAVQQNFGPKYDMKLQKEIHALQGKPMFYGSNGVVSSDGAGVGNERIKPAATDLSMNLRFS